jgi:amphi-Trp domain-containing protein
MDMYQHEREYREKHMLSRADIAGRLRRIADGVEKGTMSAGGMKVVVPERADFELEVERDELEVKIEWH